MHNDSTNTLKFETAVTRETVPTHKTVSQPGLRIEPNSADCQAKLSGFGDYADCLVDSSKRCRYALEFGDGALCRHPARLQIALRTKPSATSFVLNHVAA